MNGSMTIIRNISYKTVSKAELGLTQGHITHIGYAQNFFDLWKKRLNIDTKLTIFFDKIKKTEIVNSFINDPITNPDGSLRSPKFRSGSDDKIASLRDSIVYYYKINMMNSIGTPILILFDIPNSKYRIEAFLISTEHDFFKDLFAKLSFRLTNRNNRGEIYSRLINNSNDFQDFKILSKFFYQIKTNKKIYEKFENDETIKNEDKLISDQRNRTTVRTRIGQQNFRINVLSAYSNKCCISESDLIESIEANHIEPYRGQQSNNVQNGIPLRADIHRLWTQGLLGINNDYKVVLHDKAKNSETYNSFDGIRIKLPINPNYHPNKRALQNWCNINNLI
jgi:predicted restriction endonuclease